MPACQFHRTSLPPPWPASLFPFPHNLRGGGGVLWNGMGWDGHVAQANPFVSEEDALMYVGVAHYKDGVPDFKDVNLLSFVLRCPEGDDAAARHQVGATPPTPLPTPTLCGYGPSQSTQHPPNLVGRCRHPWSQTSSICSCNECTRIDTLTCILWVRRDPPPHTHTHTHTHTPTTTTAAVVSGLDFWSAALDCTLVPMVAAIRHHERAT
jgi:hypothetical protein